MFGMAIKNCPLSQADEVGEARLMIGIVSGLTAKWKTALHDRTFDAIQYRSEHWLERCGKPNACRVASCDLDKRPIRGVSPVWSCSLF
jgi:hypothetical protein